MKKLIVASAALLSATAFAAPPATPDQKVSAIASNVSADRMKATVTRLVSFGTRHTLSSQTDTKRGIGAALTGLRPVVELQFSDFAGVAFDQIMNQAAKLRFMMGGEPSVPLVIRMVSGAGVRLGAQHSQSLEALFAHIPGLVVAMPSNPYDAKGLLSAAIRGDDPVIFLEQKLLFFGEEAPSETVRQTLEQLFPYIERELANGARLATVIIAVDRISEKSRGKVYVYGSVKGQGPQEIPPDETYTVSKAIIRAGGFGDFADKKKIKLTRKSGETVVINLKRVIEEGHTDEDVTVGPDDQIYVPQRLINM